MKQINLRTVDDETYYRLASLAEKKDMTLPEYVRDILRLHSIAPEISEVDDRYSILMERVIELETQTNAALEGINQQLFQLTRTATRTEKRISNEKTV